MATLRVPFKKPNPASRGGIVASLRLSPSQRSERSRQAGNALLQRYGAGYFAALGRTNRKNR